MTPNKEQLKTAVQWFIGVLTPMLIAYGLPPDKIGLWATLAGEVIPPVAMFGWAIWERTHKNTLAAAGEILAQPVVRTDALGNKIETNIPSGKIIVSPNAGNGAKAAATDPKVGNVNFGPVVQSSWLVALFGIFLLLGACATVPGETAQQRATRIVNDITLAYMPVQTAAVLCISGVLCKEPAAQAIAAKAAPIADNAIAEAKRLIIASTDMTTIEKLSAVAMSAITVLAKALAGIGVTSG